MRTTVLSMFFASSLAFGALSIAACEGRVEPGTGGGSSGSEGSSGSVGTSGTGSSSGSETSGSSTGGSAGSSISGSGDPDCSSMGVPDIARICPDGSSVGGSYVLQNHVCVLEFPCPTEPSGCGPGGACSQGESCGSAASSGCGTVCMCDSTNHYVCDTCVPPPSDPCSQGAVCSPGSGCASSGASAGASSTTNNCGTTCMCDSTGIMQCTNDCEPPPPPPDPCAGYSIPNTCEVCSDGSTQCEHFSVINGQCAIEICPGKAPVMMPIPLK